MGGQGLQDFCTLFLTCCILDMPCVIAIVDCSYVTIASFKGLVK